MEFLYFLEGLRNPFLDAVMQLITRLGEETAFMAVAVFFLWCVDKYKGYYLLMVGFLGTQINQLLKVSFRIERPWVLDPEFTVVQSAVPEATGYSFPSGHTQSAVGTFGGVARCVKRRWIRIVCIAVCLLVPLSRMYLGVHTLADTITSVVIALVLVFSFYPLIARASARPKVMWILLAAIVAWSAGQILFMELFPFPEEASGEELFNGLENSYKMMGAVLGFVAAFWLDRRYIRYETGGCWWVQLIKWIVGLGLVVALQVLAGKLLGFLPVLIRQLTSYFLLTVFAGAIWPLSFKYLRRLEGKKSGDA